MNPTPIDLVLEMLDDPREIAPDKWQAHCPAHEDTRPSLSIAIGDENRVLLTCRANCDTREVVDALGLEMSDLFDDDRGARRHRDAPVRPRRPGPKTRKPERAPESLPTPDELQQWQSALLGSEPALEKCRTTKGWSRGVIEKLGIGLHDKRLRFPIRDEKGELVNVVRYTPTPGKDESKSLALFGRPRGLFPAPETIGGDTIWLVEGEPDAVTGTSLGLPAVAVPGVQGWKTKYVERFEGKRVVICMDCDEHGRKVAEQIAADLAKKGVAFKIVDLDGSRTDGYDLSDFITAATTVEDARNELLALGRDEEATQQREAEKARLREEKEAEEQAPETNSLLDQIKDAVGRFMVVSDDEAIAIPLWVLHTHVIGAADQTPYLWISSPERECGKSTLLEVLENLAASPLSTVNATPAAVYRSLGTPFKWEAPEIAAHRPRRDPENEAERPATLFFDECDNVFAARDDRTADLNGILNSGIKRGQPAVRVQGEKKEESVAFPVFGAKCLAGIGELPDTLVSRCIPIRLQRKLTSQRVEEGEAAIEAACHPIAEACLRWRREFLPILLEATPARIESLSDRQSSGVKPLLAIAELGGEEWETEARDAFTNIFERRQTADESWGVQMLRSIRTVFRDQGDPEYVESAELIDALLGDEESPWGGWNKGAGLNAKALARLIKPYGIGSRQKNTNGRNHRAYHRKDFEEMWRRYAASGDEPWPGADSDEPMAAPGLAQLEETPLFVEASSNGNGHIEMSDRELERLAAVDPDSEVRT